MRRPKLMAMQVRCTGEKPLCKRCSRLKHVCSYDDHDDQALSKRIKKVSTVRRTEPALLKPPQLVPVPQHQTEASNPTWRINAPRPLLQNQNIYYPGIPMSLIATLVEVYYANVYNATLLLHKQMFLEALQTGMASQHVVLSVCAWALK